MGARRPDADPVSTSAARLLARSSARLGSNDSALSLFQRLDPQFLEAEDHFLLACIIAKRGRPAAARALLWKAYRTDPAHGEALHQLVRGFGAGTMR